MRAAGFVDDLERSGPLVAFPHQHEDIRSREPELRR